MNKIAISDEMLAFQISWYEHRRGVFNDRVAASLRELRERREKEKTQDTPTQEGKP